MELKLRPKEECTFDAVSLGEVMLRLDPGEGRIRTARSFRAWEGGGEYNVIRGLHKCFGFKTAVITAFADNEVGMLMKDFIEQGGVSTDLIYWKKTDGIGLKNLAEYIKAPVIAACGGSYMVTADLIDNNKWDEITELCKKSVEIVKEARG